MEILKSKHKKAYCFNINDLTIKDFILLICYYSKRDKVEPIQVINAFIKKIMSYDPQELQNQIINACEIIKFNKGE